MIMNNENIQLSRKRKKRIERKIRMSSDMKLLLIKIKSEKRKKNKKFDKIKNLEIELVKIKYSNNTNKIQCALKELNKIQVVNKNLHEIKHEDLQNYTREFGMVGDLKVGDRILETHNRFRNIADYESYINTLTQLIKIMIKKILFSMVIFIK